MPPTTARELVAGCRGSRVRVTEQFVHLVSRETLMTLSPER